MKETTKIVIKGSSGYTPVDYAYNDKLTITPDSISYECNPIFEISEIEKQKWSYKTTNKEFRDSFKLIAKETIMNLDNEQKEFWCDVGSIDFTITFEDKTKRKESYFVLGEYFHDLFMLIKEIVPNTEQIPEVLKTDEDYPD